MGDRNDFTDDTDQLLVMLQSLEQTRDGRLNSINFANRLVEWRDHGIPELGTEPGRGLGYTVGRVMSHSLFRSNPHRAAFEVTKKPTCRSILALYPPTHIACYISRSGTLQGGTWLPMGP